jgi:hypothetical protein
MKFDQPEIHVVRDPAIGEHAVIATAVEARFDQMQPGLAT